MNHSNQPIGVERREVRLFLVLGFLLFTNSLALELSDVVAVSGFLEQVDVSNILILWIVDMLLIALCASFQNLIVDRFRRLTLLRGMILIFAACYGLLRLMFALDIPSVINYSILFLLVEQQWVFFPLIFWVFANDLFEMAQAKRLFASMASLGYAGQIIGLAIAAFAPQFLSGMGLTDADLLVMNGALYVLAFVLLSRGIGASARSTRTDQQSLRETFSEGFGFVREVPAFRYLTISVLATGVALTVVDFHFLATSDAFFATQPDGSFQLFYGMYRLIVTLLVIIVQTLLTGRLLERYNLKRLFLIFPVVASISLILLSLPGLAFVAAGRALFHITRGSIDEPLQKTFLALVPEERRGRVSMFIDSYLFAGGALIGCALVGAVILAGEALRTTNYPFGYLALGIMGAIIAVGAIVKLGQVYEKSLLNWRLRRRTRGANLLARFED
jgi:ATP/ADP translocase